MTQLKGIYEVKELNGKNCAIVEEGISLSRANFIKSILECNHLEVIVADNPPPKKPEDAPTEPLYIVGVANIMFNLALLLYNRKLKTPDGSILLPHFWFTGEKSPDWYWNENTRQYSIFK